MQLFWKQKSLLVESFFTGGKVGYVAIGGGLGIFKGCDGKFRPKDEMTIPEFASALYKDLSIMKRSSY